MSLSMSHLWLRSTGSPGDGNPRQWDNSVLAHGHEDREDDGADATPCVKGAWPLHVPDETGKQLCGRPMFDFKHPGSCMITETLKALGGDGMSLVMVVRHD